MAAESVVAGALVTFGAFPRGAESAIAGAAFPLNVYFDVKQGLAFASSWAMLVAALLISFLVRGGVLAGTIWLAEERRGSLAAAWGRGASLAGIAAAAVTPAVVFMYLGVAVRYAPFIWLGALAGVPAAVALARKGAGLDSGEGRPRGSGVPEAPAFLAYAYVLCALGAAMSTLDRLTPILAGVLLACVGPLHAMFLLGWREHLRAETFPGGGTTAMVATAVALVLFTGSVTYDRAIRNPSPVGTADAPGALLLLGGADSTSKTGSLTELDPRDIGFDRESTVLLSYAGAGEPYKASDTREDLDGIARLVAQQVEMAETPRLLLGHSQAALILDRMIIRGLPAPDRSVVVAPPPPVPPPMRIADRGASGEGAVGGAVARAVASVFDAVGLTAFDVDASASPTNLRPIVVIDRKVSRVSVWALGDSVWLDTDWRRPGEVNLVAMTDHVGSINNGRTLDAARSFLLGRAVNGDEVSWRGFLVSLMRYSFEPWRPG
ncbi:MAG TPA: hypothetical protein VJ927_02315 [Actinomycetota bacterium]|nr:hypothetical protein [Actinomycetota bacterium]